MSFKKSTGLPPFPQLSDSSRNRQRAKRSARNPARPAVAPRSGKRVCSSTGRASIVESLGGCCKGCWSMCNSTCPKMQTCKGQELCVLSGKWSFQTKGLLVYSFHFHPLHKKNLSRISKCSTSEGKIVSKTLKEFCFFQAVHTATCACHFYSSLSPHKEKNAYEKVQVQFSVKSVHLTAPYFCSFSRPGDTKVHAMGNATNHLTFTNHSHLGTHQLLSRP